VKLGPSLQKAAQFGGNRRFLQTQFSATQPKILLPKSESIRKVLPRFEPGRTSA